MKGPTKVSANYELLDQDDHYAAGVTFSNFGEAQEALTNSLMLKDVFGMLALDTVLYLFLAWYFDKVSTPADQGHCADERG